MTRTTNKAKKKAGNPSPKESKKENRKVHAVNRHEKRSKKTTTSKTSDSKKKRWPKAEGKKVKPVPTHPNMKNMGKETKNNKHDDEISPFVGLDIEMVRFQRLQGVRRLASLTRIMEGAQKIRLIAEATMFTGSVVIVDDDSMPGNSIVGGDEHHLVNDDENGIQVIATTTWHTSALSTTAPILSIKRQQPCSARIFLKPLIVLDVNGILCHRIRPSETNHLPPTVYRPGLTEPIAGTTIIPRPSLTSFLDFVFDNFVVGIWTSATVTTAKELVASLIPEHQRNKLLFVWHQDDCKKRWDKHRGEKETVYCKDICWSGKRSPFGMHKTRSSSTIPRARAPTPRA